MNRPRNATGITHPGRIPRPFAAGGRGAVAAVILFVAGSWTTLAQNEIFVTNASNNSVTVYAQTANGNAAPLRTISGISTGLSVPQGVAVDTVHDEVSVMNAGASSLTVFARAANGDVPPLRTISGAATGLSSGRGVSVDTAHDEIVVASGSAIRVYSRTASGNVAPLRSIAGTTTLLNNPQGLVVDTANDELVVVNVNNLITVYARTANGNVAPLRTLSGAATLLNSPRGLALDTVHDEIVVANALSPSLTVYARTALGNTAPLRTISGASTLLMTPIGVAEDGLHTEISVANFPGFVSVYGRTASGNAAPLRTISGAATGMSGSSFLSTGGPRPPVLLYTLTPCRLIDTRDPAGPYGGPALAANATRTFVISGQCGIPSSAAAVSLNIAVTQPTGAGNLTVFPAGGTPPVVSALNWNAGQTRANNGLISLGPSGDITVYLNQASGTAQLIIDATGYFQ